MKTIYAIYENGVFRPTEPVELPEKCEVEIVPRLAADSLENKENEDRLYEILRRRSSSGRSDIAERHNEHQP